MMETTVNIETYTLKIPQSAAHFLSVLAKKMGWLRKKHIKEEWIGPGFGGH